MVPRINLYLNLYFIKSINIPIIKKNSEIFSMSSPTPPPEHRCGFMSAQNYSPTSGDFLIAAIYINLKIFLNFHYWITNSGLGRFYHFQYTIPLGIC